MCICHYDLSKKSSETKVRLKWDLKVRPNFKRVRSEWYFGFDYSRKLLWLQILTGKRSRILGRGERILTFPPLLTSRKNLFLVISKGFTKGFTPCPNLLLQRWDCWKSQSETSLLSHPKNINGLPDFNPTIQKITSLQVKSTHILKQTDWCYIFGSPN